MYFIYSYYILSYTIGSTNPKVILPFFSITSLTYSLPFSVLSITVDCYFGVPTDPTVLSETSEV